MTDTKTERGQAFLEELQGLVEEQKKTIDPNAKILVLTITTSFDKRYTCRTAEELETWIDNYKAEKKLKRDEDVNIELGYGRLTEAEYARIPACKYFIKPK